MENGLKLENPCTVCGWDLFKGKDGKWYHKGRKAVDRTPACVESFPSNLVNANARITTVQA